MKGKDKKLIFHPSEHCIFSRVQRSEISINLPKNGAKSTIRSTTQANSIRYWRIYTADDRYAARESARVPASRALAYRPHRAASRRMPRGIWPRVRAGHCDSCIVRISSVHFRTSGSLTRNMISVRTLDLADPLCRRGEKHYYTDTTVCTGRAYYSMPPEYTRSRALLRFFDNPRINIHTCMFDRVRFLETSIGGRTKLYRIFLRKRIVTYILLDDFHMERDRKVYNS